jgi:hypothetical protein
MRIANAVNLYQEGDSESNELGAQNVRGAEPHILRDESDRWTCASPRTSVERRDESLDPRFLNFTRGGCGRVKRHMAPPPHPPM